MNHAHANVTPRRASLLILVGSLCCAGSALAKDFTLRGEQEVPAVTSAGSGRGSLMVNDDMTVRGTVTTSGLTGTMAHIHDGAMGMNGPVVITLEKVGDTWAVPAGSKLTPEQFKHFKAGSLYVNVHTAANPKGEIRAQLEP